MLAEKVQFEVFTPPCDPGSETYTMRMRFEADISDVLPYLHSVLEKSAYYPEAKALIWRRGRHHIAFHPQEILASNLADRESAEDIAREIIALVNATWEQRGDIQPDHQRHRRPVPMALYRLLPHTNCRECGEPTCYSFALKLAVTQRTLADCPTLSESEYADIREQLSRML